MSSRRLGQLVHQKWGHQSNKQLNQLARRGLIDEMPRSIPELEDDFPICTMTKATKLPQNPSIDVTDFAPGFLLHMDFTFVDVLSICHFTALLGISDAATSYPFGFPVRSKRPPLDVVSWLIRVLRNQGKKCAYV